MTALGLSAVLTLAVQAGEQVALRGEVHRAVAEVAEMPGVKR